LAPVIELIICAVLAGVVLYQLYAVLGRRVGRQPEDAAAEAPSLPAEGSRPALEPPVAVVETTPGLSALKARDPSFDADRFLAGARSAYETVVRAFAGGDREALKPLLSPEVYATFDAAITQRESENRTEQVEFLQAPRADLERTDLRGDVVQAVVRFLSEYRSRTKGPEGEGVDDRRTAELWTLERNLKSRDPNWVLTHVDAASA
jgi:predicted lipid-binding transport protein (Tim44 family)